MFAYMATFPCMMIAYGISHHSAYSRAVYEVMRPRSDYTKIASSKVNQTDCVSRKYKSIFCVLCRVIFCFYFIRSAKAEMTKRSFMGFFNTHQKDTLQTCRVLRQQQGGGWVDDFVLHQKKFSLSKFGLYSEVNSLRS